MKNYKIFAFILLVAFLIHLPAMIYPDGKSHSAVYNFIWTTEFADSFLNDVYYPRWAPGSFEGLGSPTFYFYPPLAFWIAGAYAALGIPPLLAVVFAGAMFSAASGMAMYYWLAARTPHALLGAIAYMLMPYHLYNFYVRGALAEYAAFVWLPLIVLSIDHLPKKHGVLFLAISYACLLLTHIPSALLATVFLIAPYAIYQAYYDRGKILPGIISAALGIGLSCFYLVPALALQDYISTDLLWSSYYQPSSWFPWNRFEIGYLIGIPTLAVTYIMCGISTRNFWGVIAIIASASSVGLIPFIWNIDLLTQVQFPWRLLGVVEFAAVTAIALGVRYKRLLKFGLIIAIMPSVAFLTTALLTIRTPMDISAIDEKRPDAPEYLPPGVKKDGITGVDRVADLTDFKHLSRGDRITVLAKGDVMIGRADFPIWQIVHNGKIIPHEGPVINFYAPEPGVYVVERKVMPSERVGWLASLITLLIILFLYISSSKYVFLRALR